ncbi:MAG TPA: hypothetical protein VK708_01905 [Bryobacteraceae bacterium]|nr:hypothetical protein [Bryobacteraceae bacterium]
MAKFAGLTIVVFTALVLPAAAQWLNYPTPGIPRTPDGKPNLSAPTPRTADGKPDLSGMWRVKQATSGETDKAMQAVKPLPWAQELSKKRKEDLGRENMSVLCLPFGPRADFAPDKIVQTPGLLMMLYTDLTYRQVFMDGRPLPQDPNPSWMGYSIGHWDGDTLVVESAGYNDRSWLDDDGHPHTEALHVTERFRRPDFGHLELEKTLEDPKALAQKWEIPIKLELDADTEILEYVCAENERDHSHLVGKASDDKQAEVKVASEILQQYVGVYNFTPPTHPEDPIPIEIMLDGGKLMTAFAGGAKYPLTAVSETRFYFEGAHMEFVKDGSGKVTHLLLQSVEGDFKAPRK